MVQRQRAMDTVRFRTVLIFLSFVGFLLPATGLVVPARALTYQPHSPITIDGNAGFTSANGVTGGSGTSSDPYIIQGWDINASGIGCCNANGNAGLVIENTNASFIVRNVYVHQGLPVDEGIILHQVSNGTVENSVTSQDYFGIAVDSSINVTVTGNTVYSNNPYGIYLYQTSTSVVSGNNVYSNQNAGIFLFSSNNDLVNNNIVYNQVVIGIDTYTTEYDTFVANNVTNNGWIGIRLLYSNYDLVYHNNLDSNGQSPGGGQGSQVMDSPTGTGGATPPQNTTNKWDDGYPQGGNYDSDNRGQDYCSGPAQNICVYPDGISDTSYPILSEFVYNYAAQYYYITSLLQLSRLKNHQQTRHHHHQALPRSWFCCPSSQPWPSRAFSPFRCGHVRIAGVRRKIEKVIIEIVERLALGQTGEGSGQIWMPDIPSRQRTLHKHRQACTVL